MGRTETPGDYESFSAEEKQMLFELMTHTEDNAEIWLERYDDVAVKTGTVLELVQVKSATNRRNNPLSNKSPHLWKTLSNWVDKLKEFEQDDSLSVSKCRYSVSSPLPLSEGSVLTLFNKALSRKEAEDAIVQAMIVVGTPAKNKKAYFDNFTSCQNREYAANVIRLLEYELHVGFDREILNLFHRTSFVSANLEPGLFKAICGWLRREVSQYTEKGVPAVARRSEYCDELRKASQLRRDNPLIQPVEGPTPDEVETERDRKPNYLTQLQLIGIDAYETRDEDGMRAIIEKLQSDSLVAQLAKEGTISQQGFDGYRTDLVSEWRDVYQEKVLQSTGNDASIGQQIYFGTRRVTQGTKLQSFDPPRFLTCGQLHALADETDKDLGIPRIGWHPHYADKLKRRNVDKDAL